MDANMESACAEILCNEYQFSCHVTIPQPAIDEIAFSAAIYTYQIIANGNQSKHGIAGFSANCILDRQHGHFLRTKHVVDCLY
jgi:hypothetical protein